MMVWRAFSMLLLSILVTVGEAANLRQGKQFLYPWGPQQQYLHPVAAPRLLFPAAVPIIYNQEPGLCGVAHGSNFPVEYDQDGQDVEAAERLKKGRKPTGRITPAGNEAEKHEWPWAVSIRVNGNHVCGGSLLDDRHILSAAHCFRKHPTDETEVGVDKEDVKRMTVLLGAHNISLSDEPGRHISPVKRVAYHAEFNGLTGFQHDLAVLTLETPVPANLRDTIRPVCLPSRSNDLVEDTFEGKVATVVGWGASHIEGKPSDVLMELSMKVHSVSECRQLWSNLEPSPPPDFISAKQICVGEKTRDACRGDSGGPLLLPVDGRWTQVGIVSFGAECGKFDAPGVYTRTTSWLDWIEKQLQKS